MLAGMDAIQELRYLVLAVQRDGNRALSALLRPLGVTPAQAELLRVLADAGRPLTVREVGDRLVCEPGSPSRLASSLVDGGLVERLPHPTDARATALALSRRGQQTAEDVLSVEERFHDDLRARLGPQSQADSVLAALRGLAGDGPSARALRRRLETKAP